MALVFTILAPIVYDFEGAKEDHVFLVEAKSDVLINGAKKEVIKPRNAKTLFSIHRDDIDYENADEMDLDGRLRVSNILGDWFDLHGNRGSHVILLQTKFMPSGEFDAIPIYELLLERTYLSLKNPKPRLFFPAWKKMIDGIDIDKREIDAISLLFGWAETIFPEIDREIESEMKRYGDKKIGVDKILGITS